MRIATQAFLPKVISNHADRHSGGIVKAVFGSREGPA
jgi:hypothetical protein